LNDFVSGNGECYFAVVDCGSNSFHLAVAKILSVGKFEIVRREREVLRIGVNETGEKIISENSIKKAIETLSRFKKISDSYKAPIKAVATSAIRESKNRAEAISLIKEKSGVNINVIDGKEEARLIFMGINNAVSLNNEKTLCIDIGGGSTELIVGKGSEIIYLNSFPLGAVRLSEKFFPDYILLENAVKDCEEYISSILKEAVVEIRNIGFTKCAGTSGTIMSSAFMIKALTGEIPNEIYTLNNFTFNKSEFDKIFRSIIEAKKIEEREKISGLDSGRADIIPAGLLILNYLIKALDINEILVSSQGIREGVIVELMNKKISKP